MLNKLLNKKFKKGNSVKQKIYEIYILKKHS